MYITLTDISLRIRCEHKRRMTLYLGEFPDENTAYNHTIKYLQNNFIVTLPEFTEERKLSIEQALKEPDAEFEYIHPSRWHALYLLGFYPKTEKQEL